MTNGHLQRPKNKPQQYRTNSLMNRKGPDGQPLNAHARQPAYPSMPSATPHNATTGGPLEFGIVSNS